MCVAGGGARGAHAPDVILGGGAPNGPRAGSEMLGKKCIAIFCDAKPILYSNSYNLCSNSLFTFDTVLTDGMVTGHHHLRRIKNVYYALWADVGVLFSADSLWDNWPERVRGVI